MIKTFLAAILISGMAGPALAQERDDEVSEATLQKFKTMYPNTNFRGIRKSKIPGIYELRMGENVAYADESGRYFIFGHLFDMQQQVDLTAQSKRAGRKTEFPSKYLDNAIKTVKGDGSRVLAVFSDPDCPYCRSLERELGRLDNVTIYTFLFPLETIHPEAKTRAISIWCATDREKAWHDQMLSGMNPKLLACENPINDNLLLGSRLGVSGTPTLIASDGRIMPGSAPAERIDKWLDATKPAVSDSAKKGVAP